MGCVTKCPFFYSTMSKTLGSDLCHVVAIGHLLDAIQCHLHHISTDLQVLKEWLFSPTLIHSFTFTGSSPRYLPFSSTCLLIVLLAGHNIHRRLSSCIKPSVSMKQYCISASYICMYMYM